MSSEFEKRTRELLDDSAGRIDGRTRSRLTQARHAALAQLDRPARQWLRPYLPAAAGAAAVVLVIAMWIGQAPEQVAPAAQNGGAFEDIDLLADSDAPDFVAEVEDLEFYEWAAGEVET
jgi:hypothetical protein